MQLFLPARTLYEASACKLLVTIQNDSFSTVQMALISFEVMEDWRYRILVLVVQSTNY